DAEAPPGLYHCVNSGYGTWWELAEEIGRQLGVTPKLKPVAVETVKLRAPRPKYCALSNTKLTDAGFTMPMWQDALGRYLKVRTDG
ncbi:MAG: sugar nucleotide-binding protein, partial [Vicinamibacterales bacterium]|nr:sugar nucleotide-binding protein [Vicinamibacterales bacterium]